MVKFKLPIKNILGLSYYRYSLSTSTTNPTLNSTFTETVKVTNVFGNPVQNKTVTLYYKGASQGEQTTDENGEATWTITASATGLGKITVGNSYNYVNVTDGWHSTSIHNGNGTLYYNPTLRICSLRYSRTFNSASANTMYEWGQQIPSTYRPNYMVTGSGNRNGATLTVDSDGYLYGRFQLAFSSETNFYYHLMWHY